MKFNYILLKFMLVSSYFMFSQVGIGTTNPKAALEINSINSGILIPRLSTALRNAITSPTEGLLVYVNDGIKPGFYYFNSVNWVCISDGGKLAITIENGNTGFRLKEAKPENYGDIGLNAVDLSFSNVASTYMGATGTFAFTRGHDNNASAESSVAMGYNNIANSFSEFVIGHNATNLIANDKNNIDDNDRVFSVGIGLNSSNRSDALEVFKNGKIYADELEIAEITDNKQLVTKEYIDTYITTSYQIGDSHLGGIVYYTWDGGTHGLIVADIEFTGINWGSQQSQYRTYGTAKGIGSGSSNTNLIMSKHSSASIAAARSHNLEIEVNNIKYGGWYLPSYQELKFLYDSADIINSNLTNQFIMNATRRYWTSSEQGESNAFIFKFNNAGTLVENETLDKSNTTNTYARAVKQF